jgi:hypothetical protein
MNSLYEGTVYSNLLALPLPWMSFERVRVKESARHSYARGEVGGGGTFDGIALVRPLLRVPVQDCITVAAVARSAVPTLDRCQLVQVVGAQN